MDAGREPLERAYREEATRIRAALAARTGDVGLAEDAVQDAFIEAIEHWPRDGVPASPGGWLATTARRKALDRLRRDKVGADKMALLAATEAWACPDTGPGAAARQAAEDGGRGRTGGADDELLSLAFACCHPALTPEAQVALTLRAVCGLTTDQIAAAFLVSEPTMAQRLLRARKTLSGLKAPVTIPDPDDLADRLAQVLAVVYLVFNEGYLASSGRQPARRDLAAQAIALTRTLHRLMPREPEVLGLLALLLLHESRAKARFDGWGRLIRLKDQDRAHWDKRLADEAAAHLDRAIALRRAGPYQVQAAIAALHAEASVLRGDRLAADPPPLQPAPAAGPVPGGAAEPGGRHPLRHGRRAGPGRDRAPVRRSRRLSPVPRAPRGPARRARPRRGGRSGPRASARAGRQPGRARAAHPRPVAVNSRGTTPVPPDVRAGRPDRENRDRIRPPRGPDAGRSLGPAWTSYGCTRATSVRCMSPMPAERTVQPISMTGRTSMVIQPRSTPGQVLAISTASSIVSASMTE